MGTPAGKVRDLAPAVSLGISPGPTGAHAAELSRASSPEVSALAEVICS